MHQRSKRHRQRRELNHHHQRRQLRNHQLRRLRNHHRQLTRESLHRLPELMVIPRRQARITRHLRQLRSSPSTFREPKVHQLRSRARRRSESRARQLSCQHLHHLLSRRRNRDQPRSQHPQVRQHRLVQHDGSRDHQQRQCHPRVFRMSHSRLHLRRSVHHARLRRRHTLKVRRGHQHLRRHGHLGSCARRRIAVAGRLTQHCAISW